MELHDNGWVQAIIFMQFYVMDWEMNGGVSVTS